MSKFGCIICVHMCSPKNMSSMFQDVIWAVTLFDTSTSWKTSSRSQDIPGLQQMFLAHFQVLVLEVAQSFPGQEPGVLQPKMRSFSTAKKQVYAEDYAPKNHRPLLFFSWKHMLLTSQKLPTCSKVFQNRLGHVFHQTQRSEHFLVLEPSGKLAKNWLPRTRPSCHLNVCGLVTNDTKNTTELACRY